MLSRAIRWRIDSAISHVEFWDSETGETLGARFPDGVKFRPPSENLAQAHIILATFPGIEYAYEWVRMWRVGRPYDLKGIIGIATAQDWHAKRGRFCSEIVLEGAEHRPKTFKDLLNRNVRMWRITPRDLLLSPELTIL